MVLHSVFVVLLGLLGLGHCQNEQLTLEECFDKYERGIYPHDSDCTKFLSCATADTLDCPAGLHFNPTEFVCDWPANAGCMKVTTPSPPPETTPPSGKSTEATQPPSDSPEKAPGASETTTPKSDSTTKSSSDSSSTPEEASKPSPSEGDSSEATSPKEPNEASDATPSESEKSDVSETTPKSLTTPSDAADTTPKSSTTPKESEKDATPTTSTAPKESEKPGEGTETTPKSSTTPSEPEKPSDASETTPKSSTPSSETEKPSDASETTRKASSTPSDAEKPSAETTPKPSTTPSESEKPSDTSETTPKSSSTPSEPEKSSDATVTTPKPSETTPKASTTTSESDKPSEASETTPKISTTPSETEKPSEASETTPKTSTIPSESDKPSEASETTSKTSTTPSESDKTSEASETTQKTSTTPSESDKPSEVSETTPKSSATPSESDKPSEASETTQKTSTTPSESDKPSEASETTQKTSTTPSESDKPSEASETTPKTSTPSDKSDKPSESGKSSPQPSTPAGSDKATPSEPEEKPQDSSPATTPSDKNVEPEQPFPPQKPGDTTSKPPGEPEFELPPEPTHPSETATVAPPERPPSECDPNVKEGCDSPKPPLERQPPGGSVNLGNRFGDVTQEPESERREPLTEPPQYPPPGGLSVKECLAQHKFGIFEHPTDPTKFFICTKSTPLEMKCPEGLQFDQASYGCGRPKVTTSPPPPELNLRECTKQYPRGLFPHPSDCSKFYVCTKRSPLQMSCPEGLHFNPMVLMCDWPSRYCVDPAAKTRDAILRAMKGDRIVPDLVDRCPNKLAEVAFPSGGQADLGKELTPSQTLQPPSIYWEADQKSFYTLCMVDPDAPKNNQAPNHQLNHWTVGNIPGNQISQGQPLAEYLPPCPQRNSPPHRYTYMIYKQPSRISFNEPKIPANSFQNRDRFNLRSFVERYQLGNPIAGNYFKCRWDRSVPQILQRLQNVPAQFSMMIRPGFRSNSNSFSYSYSYRV